MLTPIRVFWRRISMDFELTKSQKEIQKAAREFARGEFDKELALEMDKKHQFPTKIWKKAGGSLSRGIFRTGSGRIGKYHYC
jgi:hypothetical protein